MGRAPGPDDILVPKQDGRNREAHFVLYWFRHDCEVLGLRQRTTLPWNALCEEVAKLRIGLRDGRLIQLPKVASSRRGTENFTTVVTTDTARQSEILSIPRAWSSALNVPDGIRSREGGHQEVLSGEVSSEIPRASAEPHLARYAQPQDDCSNCSKPVSAELDVVADQLEAVRLIWVRNGDEKLLRRALLDLLRQLEGREA